MPKYLRQPQVAAEYGFNQRTLERWRHEGGGPPFFKVRGVVMYRADEIDEWIESHRSNVA